MAVASPVHAEGTCCTAPSCFVIWHQPSAIIVENRAQRDEAVGGGGRLNMFSVMPNGPKNIPIHMPKSAPIDKNNPTTNAPAGRKCPVLFCIVRTKPIDHPQNHEKNRQSMPKQPHSVKIAAAAPSLSNGMYSPVHVPLKWQAKRETRKIENALFCHVPGFSPSVIRAPSYTKPKWQPKSPAARNFLNPNS